MRLNFQGALAGLGRGLSTLGQQGIEEQQRVAADARLQAREQAMAALSHGYRTQEADAEVGRDVQRYESLTGPTVKRAALESENVRQPERRMEIEATAASQAARDTREHQFRVQLEALQHDYRLSEDQARQALADSLADNNISEWRVSRDGQLVAYDRTGRQIAHSQAGTYEPPSPTHGPDDEDGEPTPNRNLPEPRRVPATGRGGRPVLAAPRPVARGADTPPIAGARRAADGNWYVTRNGQNFLVQGN